MLPGFDANLRLPELAEPRAELALAAGLFPVVLGFFAVPLGPLVLRFAPPADPVLRDVDVLRAGADRGVCFLRGGCEEGIPCTLPRELG